MSSSRWNRTYQIGVVVKDLRQAQRHYEAAGIGPFTEGPSRGARERRVYGEAAPDVVVDGSRAAMGPLELELLQPVSGKSIQSDILRSTGEGVIHICAYTDDLDGEIANMNRSGFPVISSGIFDDGGRFAYFDTRATGGLILELFEPGGKIR